MSNLRHHKTVSDLSTQDGSDDQENVDLSVPSPDISDPRNLYDYRGYFTLPSVFF